MPKRVRDGSSGRRLSTWSVHTAASNDAIDAMASCYLTADFPSLLRFMGRTKGTARFRWTWPNSPLSDQESCCSADMLKLPSRGFASTQ